MFGESALLGERRNATVVARSFCDIYTLSRVHFWEALAGDPKLRQRVLDRVRRLLCCNVS